TAALLAQPVVVFVVLVADQFFIEWPHPRQHRARIGGKGDGIGIDRPARRGAKRGIADAEARAHADGDRPGDHGLANRVERSADRVDTGLEVADGPADVIGRNLAVPVDAHDDLAAGRRKSKRGSGARSGDTAGRYRRDWPAGSRRRRAPPSSRSSAGPGRQRAGSAAAATPGSTGPPRPARWS